MLVRILSRLYPASEHDEYLDSILRPDDPSDSGWTDFVMYKDEGYNLAH